MLTRLRYAMAYVKKKGVLPWQLEKKERRAQRSERIEVDILHKV